LRFTWQKTILELKISQKKKVKIKVQEQLQMANLYKAVDTKSKREREYYSFQGDEQRDVTWITSFHKIQ
jgi:hypothetical protein